MKKQKLELDKRQTSLVQRKKFKMSELVAFKKIITFTYTSKQSKLIIPEDITHPKFVAFLSKGTQARGAFPLNQK